MSVEDSAEASKKLWISIAVRRALSDGIDKGGLTDEERAALAARHGVSEAVLLRWERALQAYRSVIGEKQHMQARLEAVRYVNEHGKELYSKEFWEEKYKALERIEASLPEQGIVREFRAADNAFMAALGIPLAWDLPPEDAPIRYAGPGDAMGT